MDATEIDHGRTTLAGLARRSTEPELMDDPAFGDAALHARVLADLARVNRLTRTHVPLLRFLRRAWAGLPPRQTFSVLDIGSGEGDLLRAVRDAAARDGRPVRLTGIDMNPAATAAARTATSLDSGADRRLEHTLPGQLQSAVGDALGEPADFRDGAIDFVTADVFGYDDGVSHDLIVSAQVAHHLDDARLVDLLRWVDRRARLGWCIADLRRHWLPYLGFRWLARAMRWHPVVRIDGTRSIARACTVGEWQALVERAGVRAEVRSHFPFRISVRSTRPPGRSPDDAACTTKPS